MSQVFPEWANKVPRVILAGLIVFGTTVVFVVWYFFTPKYTDVGYAPDQPVPYSHQFHVGELGLDCQYCHTTVKVSAKAAIPPAATCMNCHSQIKTDSPKLEPIREAYFNDKPVEWVRVHMLPDYSYFNHSAHVNVGVSCVSCHGRVDRMEVVTQKERLSMGWCLDCHRNPAPNLRPVEEVTNLAWEAPEDPQTYGEKLMAGKNIHPPLYCNGCHR